MKKTLDELSQEINASHEKSRGFMNPIMLQEYTYWVDDEKDDETTCSGLAKKGFAAGYNAGFFDGALAVLSRKKDQDT